MAYEGSWWHEGMTYALGSLGDPASFANAWSTETDENMWTWVQNSAGNLFEGWFEMLSYAMRPDYNYVYWGDTTSTKQSIQLFSRRLVDTLNSGRQSPLGQALSIEIKKNTPAVYDYPGDAQFWKALFYDDIEGRLGDAAHHAADGGVASSKAADVAVMRSGWGPNDTFVWVSCGDYFGAHGHDEAGAFQVFRTRCSRAATAPTTTSTPCTGTTTTRSTRCTRTRSRCTQPGEVFPNSQTLNGHRERERRRAAPAAAARGRQRRATIRPGGVQGQQDQLLVLRDGRRCRRSSTRPATTTSRATSRRRTSRRR